MTIFGEAFEVITTRRDRKELTAAETAEQLEAVLLVLRISIKADEEKPPLELQQDMYKIEAELVRIRKVLQEASNQTFVDRILQDARMWERYSK